VNNVLNVNHNRTLFSYDTTFNIGDFYMSPLVCRHPLFKNEPSFPIAFLFHETKTAPTHKVLFNFVKEVNILV
jgi:hypothetical protein